MLLFGCCSSDAALQVLLFQVLLFQMLLYGLVSSSV